MSAQPGGEREWVPVDFVLEISGAMGAHHAWSRSGTIDLRAAQTLLDVRSTRSRAIGPPSLLEIQLDRVTGLTDGRLARILAASELPVDRVGPRHLSGPTSAPSVRRAWLLD